MDFVLIVIQRRIIITFNGFPFLEDAAQFTSFDISCTVGLPHAGKHHSIVGMVFWLPEFFYFNYITLFSKQSYEVVVIMREHVHRGELTWLISEPRLEFYSVS